MVTDLKKELFAKRIIIWGKTNRRSFLWRQSKNPFHILIAELLLQRTAAKQVEPVYTKIIMRYSSPAELANARLEDILTILKPLGLAYRASRLIEISRFLQEEFQGIVPSDKKELMKLRGVGNYSANAVLSFAFGKDVAVVDANVLRVIKRVFSIEVSAESHKDLAIWSFVNGLIPKGQASDFNFSLIDFSSLVCSSKNPKHKICPIKGLCNYYHASLSMVQESE
jgi:A/G-specific adenine glycosylase